MEWNSTHYQYSQQPTRTQYWHYGNEEDPEEVRQSGLSSHSHHYNGENAFADPFPMRLLKMEPSINGNGSMDVLYHPKSSLDIPQTDEATEFQPFLPSQSAAFLDNAFLSLSQQRLQCQSAELQQHSEQLPSQIPAQFEQIPPFPTGGMDSLVPPTSVLHTAARSDNFSEGIHPFSNVHSPVSTLLPTFGQLQSDEHPALEDKNDSFAEPIARDTSSTVFSAPIPTTSTKTTVPPRMPIAFPSSPLNNSPIAGRKRGWQLSEKFTGMTTKEPKSSPDKRKLCCVEGCKSQARTFNRCKRHGGSKRCSSPGCTRSVQSRGLCIRHGGGSRCQEEGCTRASQSYGRCKMHGGGRPCIVAGCQKKAHLKRLCRKHGGGTKCCVVGCDKWAQCGGMCMTHSKVAATQPTAIDIVSDTVLNDRKLSPRSGSSPPLQILADEEV